MACVRSKRWFSQDPNFTEDEIDKQTPLNFSFGFHFRDYNIAAVSVAYDVNGQMGLFLRLHTIGHSDGGTLFSRMSYLIHKDTYKITERVAMNNFWTCRQFKPQRLAMLLAFDCDMYQRLPADVMQDIHKHLWPVCAECEKRINGICSKCWSVEVDSKGQQKCDSTIYFTVQTFVAHKLSPRMGRAFGFGKGFASPGWLPWLE